MTAPLSETETLRPSVAAGARDAQSSDRSQERPSHQGQAYRPDIDGLRAVAVLAVVLYHAGLPLAPGGFVGVDIFFVISGFVICKSLSIDLERRQFSIAAFYERRIRRIFPALTVTFLATWATAYGLLLPSYFVDFSKSLAAAAAFVSNIYFWRHSGYFANGADLRPLLHTWSLAVEEQFYIFAPLAMFVIHRFMGGRWRLAFLPVAAASLALSVLAVRVAPTANFFLLPTRAWELLIGGLLALSPPPPLPPRARRLRESAALLGLALIAWAVVGYSKATPFPGLAALPPCLGAALLIHTGAGPGPRTMASRALSWKPVVGVGLISYSLYLAHWPVISFLTYYRLRPPGSADVLPILGVSLVLAYLSWRFVERPFRGRALVSNRRTVLVGGMLSMVLVLGLGLAGAASGGLPGRFPNLGATVERDPKGLWREGRCFFDNNPDFGPWTEAGCAVTGGAEPVLLWGDSYAAHYVPGLVAAGRGSPLKVLEYTAAGCPPILSYVSYSRPRCQAFNANALKIIQRDRIRTVILSARWVDLERRGLGELRSTLDALKGLGVTAYVIGQSPMFTTDVQLIAARHARPGDVSSWPLSFDETLNRRLAALAGPGLFVDPIARFCAHGACPYREGGKLLFGDEGHFSAWGSRRAVESYFPLAIASQPGGRR